MHNKALADTPPKLSWQVKVLNFFLRHLIKPLIKHGRITPEILLRGQKMIDAISNRHPPPRYVTIENFYLEGLHVEKIECEDAGHTGKAILYLHGGGYFFGSPRTHRPIAWRMAKWVKASVFLPEYRKAPQNKPSDALEDAITTYRHLLERDFEPRHLAIAGDSAGGNLTFALLQRIRALGLPYPACAITFSPWGDLSADSESLVHNHLADPFFPGNTIIDLGAFYCQGRDPHDPELSPVYADFSGFPPLEVHVGSSEVLLDDARRLIQRAHAAGVQARLIEWPHMPHVFQAFADFVPEGREGIRRACNFLDSHLND